MFGHTTESSSMKAPLSWKSPTYVGAMHCKERGQSSQHLCYPRTTRDVQVRTGLGMVGQCTAAAQRLKTQAASPTTSLIALDCSNTIGQLQLCDLQSIHMAPPLCNPPPRRLLWSQSHPPCGAAAQQREPGSRLEWVAGGALGSSRAGATVRLPKLPRLELPTRLVDTEHLHPASYMLHGTPHLHQVANVFPHARRNEVAGVPQENFAARRGTKGGVGVRLIFGCQRLVG